MKKVISLVIVACSLALLGLGSAAEDNPAKDSASQSNLLQNPSFEQADDSGKMPAGWAISAWDSKPGVSRFRYDKGEAHSGNMFVTIINNSENDARFTQNIDVKNNASYRLSCWIKTENVGSSQNGKGANISVEGKLETSRDLKGTNGKWEYVEMYVRTGSGISTMKVTIGMGGYGSVNKGTASFDDVLAEEVNSIPAGAIAAQLGDTGRNSSAGPSDSGQSSAAGSLLSVGSPGKTVWYLTAAAIIVAAGAAIYYFVYAGKEPDMSIGKEISTGSETTEGSPPEDESPSDIENAMDDIGGNRMYDKEDLL